MQTINEILKETIAQRDRISNQVNLQEDIINQIKTKIQDSIGGQEKSKTTLAKVLDKTIVELKRKDLVGAKQLGARVLSDCVELQRIIMPDTVEEVGLQALSNCKKLSSVTIPNSVTNIGGNAFNGCDNLKTVKYTGTIDDWAQIGFTTASSNPLYYSQELKINNAPVTEINFDDSLTTINPYAFYNYNSLEKVIIGESITFISYEAFRGCNNLKTIEIPNNVITIGEQCFQDCTALESITIGSGLKEIRYSAFAGCNNLKTIYYYGMVEDWNNIIIEDGNDVLKNCKLYCLTDLMEGSSEGLVYTISNDGTFAQVSGYNGSDTIVVISNVYQGLYVEAISDSAFENNSIITEVVIPSSVTKVGNSSFKNCSELKNIQLTNSITDIGSSVFENCTKLERATISTSATKVSEKMFNGCIALKYVTIPNSVKSIDVGAFQDCTNLEKITIPNSVITIGDSSFAGCSSLKNIAIPDSVENIDIGAFYGCNNLVDLNIGNSVTNIRYEAFRGCSNLKNIYYNGDYYKRLTLQISGGNDELHEANWYYLVGTAGLVYAKSEDETYVSINNYIGDNYNVSTPDIFEGLSITVISNGAFENKYITEMIISDSVQRIGDSSFKSCKYLTNVTIGQRVTSIGNDAFRGCDSLTGITIGNNVISVGKTAFYNCSSLTSITIPKSVKRIGRQAFANLLQLTKVNYTGTIDDWVQIEFGDETANPLYQTETFNINNQLITTVNINTATQINDYAFYGYKTLTGVTIGNSVTNIGIGVFEGCRSLERVALPFVGSSLNGTLDSHFGYIFGAQFPAQNYNFVPISLKMVELIGGEKIGYEAFLNCSHLTSIIIPKSVKSIDINAFQGCSGLTNVYYRGTIDDWNKITIKVGNNSLTNATIVYNYQGA